MAEYKIETHAHTAEVSPCGRMTAEELVTRYYDSRYSTLIITDHFSLYPPFMNSGMKWKDKVDRYFTGYELARAKGDELGLAVLAGMEITFDDTPEDYLVYGLSREWLYDNENLTAYNIKEFSRKVSDTGCLIIQAHPFRSYLTATRPPFIHGAEVYNGNPRHDSQNDKALAHAKKYNLMQTSGSDAHQKGDCARGGMIFPRPVRSMEDFIHALQSVPHSLIESGHQGTRKDINP